MYNSFVSKMSFSKIDTLGFPSMILGQVGKAEKNVADSIKKTVEKYNSISALVNVADSYREFPTSTILDILVDSLKHGGGGVAEAFFGGKSAPANWGRHDCTAGRDELAVLLLSDDLSKVKSRNFGKTTNGSLANHKWKSLISSPKGVALGKALLTEVLIKDHGFLIYLNDPKKWLPQLESLLQEKPYILGTLVKQLASQSSLSVHLKVFFLEILGSKKIPKILTTWKEVTGDPKIADSAENFIQRYNNLAFAVGKLDADIFVNDVTTACNKSNTHSWSTTPPMVMPGQMVIPTEHTETTFGSSVASWLNSGNGPKKFGVRTGQNPNNVAKSSHQDNPFGCFVAGTQVLVHDGSVNIEYLNENDKIIGADGVVGVVSSEKVCRVLDQNTPIYGFNDEAPFFLAGHPFWTQHGWRALSPHSAKTENAWLEVGQLTEGDFVKRVSDQANESLEYEWVEIKSFHFKDVPAGDKVYGVHVREGLRSYHANGYLVNLNYPEITAQTAQEGMKNLSSKEQEQFHSKLKELTPHLHKVLGPGPADAILKLAQGYNDNLHMPTQKHSKVHLKEVTLPHISLTPEAGKTSHGSYKIPKKASLVRGHLFLDDEHVSDVHVSHDDKVSWNRPVSDGKWEHGSMKLYPDKQVGHAFVAVTNKKNDNHSLVSATLTATSNVNTYHGSISTAPIQNDTPGNGTTYEAFGGLKMGTKIVDGRLQRVGKINTPAMGDTYDNLSNHVIFSVNSKYELIVDVSVPTAYQEIIDYVTFHGKFSWDYSSFSGYAVKYDPTQAGNEGAHYAWKGDLHVADHPRLLSMHNVARSTALKSSMSSTKCSRNMVKSSASTPMMSQMMTLSDNQLTVEHLFTLPPPDSQSLHDLTFSLLQKAMKYKMDDSDRANILGVVKPTDLDAELTTVADKYESFFKDKFANAYLMNGLSQAETYATKITDAQRDKLLYYWMGQDDGCLGTDKDYNAANNEVARAAFIQSCPEIQKYMTSPQGGTYWSKQLYDKLTSDSVLNGLALTQDVGNTSPIIQKQTMVLYCLDQNTSYPTDFYTKINITRMNETASKFSGNKDDAALMKEVITDYMHQLIITILAGGDATSAELNAELTKQLEDAAKELNVKIKKDQALAAKDMMTKMDAAIDFCLAYFNATTGPMMNRVAKGMEQWLTDHPKSAMMSKFLSSSFTMACWGMSLTFTIKTFMNWKKLNKAQKVQVCTETVALTFTTIAKFPSIIQKINVACEKGEVAFDFIMDWLNVSTGEPMEQGIEMTIMVVEKDLDAEVISIEQALAEGANYVADDIEESVISWQKFFAVTETFAKVTGVLALVAGCVTMGFQIANDYKTDAPTAQKVLDILQGVTMGVATIAATVGLFVEAACIPVIGIVCAVVGIVLVIANLFVHRDPPKPKPTKIDLYVSGSGAEFVKTLKSPSQEWLDDYHKKTDQTTPV